MGTQDIGTVPPVGTRPAHRRILIVEAGIRLFSEVGYTGVSMADIARAVNVQPSALYRHFGGKDALFAAAARESIAPARAALEQPVDFDAMLRALAAAAVDSRAAGVLWLREARHAPAQVRSELREEYAQVAALLRARLCQERPDLQEEQADLLAAGILAGLASISFHRIQVSPRRFTKLLYEAVRRVADVSLPGMHAEPLPPHDSGSGRLAMRSRREGIVGAAARLIAERGVASVTIEEIGEAAGIAGPSVYSYFSGKQELLAAVLNRGNEWLWAEVTRTFAQAGNAEQAVDGLLRSYLVLAVEHGMASVLIGDLGHLAEQDRERFRQAQHDYLREWSALLSPGGSQQEETAARLRVNMAIMIINHVARTPHLRRLPHAEPALLRIAKAALGTPAAV
ncbi:TetR/AcrR family transcriptional regulator [Streptomyces cinereospinus]|uniref:TetR/AcrR family transcriptional regulator n=1 Tax=Streptomyces cinereospinus TaxID=285561 RepID=A0ABV5MY53_9ACTN